MSVIFFDIETRPDKTRALESFDPDDVKLGALKDPDKIKHKIKEAKDKLVERAALSPATGSIVAIGMAHTAKEGVKILGKDEETGELTDEATLLGEFWTYFKMGATWINWPGSQKANFDRKFLIRRSWANGVEVPETAFEHPRWYNLTSRFLIGEDYSTYQNLEKAARELGIEVKGTSPVEGANFWEYWTSDNKKEAAAAQFYLEQDVKLVREIWQKIC